MSQNSKKLLLLLILFSLLLVGSGLVTANGGLSLDWYSLDGGGGLSVGDEYDLMGVVGQHDVGTTASGGTYELDGGFLASPASSETILYLPMIVRE